MLEFLFTNFPFKVAKLRREIICFEQQKNESLGEAWEHFNAVVNSGPSLDFLEPMLLQHFFIGLNRRTRKYLNLASRGAFMHITAECAKTILINILNDLPKETLLEEKEISIAEPELLPKISQPLAIVELELPQKEEEEFSLPDVLFDIEDDLFTNFGNTSNYHLIEKPQQPRNFATIDPTHSDDVDFLKKTTILSDEGLEE
jgi:hypothetical protein